MTIDTPFPPRKATPWLVSSRPTPLSGYTFPNGEPCDPGMSGPQCQDTTGRILTAVAAGSMAAQNVIDPQPYYNSCAPGLLLNPATMQCQPGVSGTVSASGSPIVWILLAGAALYLLMGRR